MSQPECPLFLIVSRSFILAFLLLNALESFKSMNPRRRKMRSLKMAKCVAVILALSVLFILSVAAISYAKTAVEIDASVNAALHLFKKDVRGADEYLRSAKGVLVMPSVTKVAFIVGGKYGQGALRIGNKTAGYYSLASGSLGYQIGAEKYDMVIIFLTDRALRKFRESEGWEAGVDAEVTLIDVGASGSVGTLRSQHPIIGFVFDEKGLMAGVSIKGAKFTKIHPD
jgi:lipid-binding SYLF domain-containing protein